MSKNTEITTTNNAGYLVLKDFNLTDVMAEEMSGLSASFERIKIEEYQGGSNPPDCGSYDGVCGTGNPGGLCKSCPYNAFGSGKNGAKACKNRRRLYLLREGEIFPMILSLPTGSLKGFTRYLMRILPKYKNFNAVVTRFTLKKANSNTGIAYSQAQFSVDRVLTPEEYALVSAMSEQVKELSVSVGYDTEEANAVNVDPETGEIIEPLN